MRRCEAKTSAGYCRKRAAHLSYLGTEVWEYRTNLNIRIESFPVNLWPRPSEPDQYDW